MTDTTKPGPCPFCGGETTLIDGTGGPLIHGAFAECAQCNISSPICPTAAEAIAAWNRRPSPAVHRQASAGQEEVALIEKAAIRVGITSLMNQGAASCVYSEGCSGVTQEHLIAFAREIAVHCAATLPTAAPESGWRPIETAPSGAKGVAWMQLAWGPEEDRKTGYGMRIEDKFYAAATFFCLVQEKQFELREVEVQPTHWQPLPAAPTAGETL